MKFKAVNWVAIIAWAGGVAAANFAPGIPPINALVGTSIIYVAGMKIMSQKETVTVPLKEKDEVVSDY